MSQTVDFSLSWKDACLSRAVAMGLGQEQLLRGEQIELGDDWKQKIKRCG